MTGISRAVLLRAISTYRYGRCFACLTMYQVPGTGSLPGVTNQVPGTELKAISTMTLKTMHAQPSFSHRPFPSSRVVFCCGSEYPSERDNTFVLCRICTCPGVRIILSVSAHGPLHFIQQLVQGTR